VHSLLTTVSEELPDVPLYFNLHDTCKLLRTTAPRSEVFRSALVNAGFRVSGTHAHPLGMKTDAPWEVVWDVMRCWVKEHPVKKPAAGSAGVCVFFWGGGAARADRALAEPA
jgi:tRNA (guanine26-N2/guanine27-N2)-dimethyltransferase